MPLLQYTGVLAHVVVKQEEDFVPGHNEYNMQASNIKGISLILSIVPFRKLTPFQKKQSQLQGLNGRNTFDKCYWHKYKNTAKRGKFT